MHPRVAKDGTKEDALQGEEVQSPSAVWRSAQAPKGTGVSMHVAVVGRSGFNDTA